LTTTITNESSLGVSFIEEFFINPIIEKTGYNMVNTITYGVLLIIGAYTIFKFVKKIGIKIDFKFLLINVPFILLVSVWRATTDAGIYPYTFLTTTPGLYIPVLLLYFPLLYLSAQLERKRKIPYWKLFVFVSTALLISQVIFLRVNKPDALGLFSLFAAISIAPFFALKRWVKPLRDKFNLSIFVTHMIDASATHVSITYFNYFEQHVIPNFFIWLFGSTWGFYILKLIVLIPIIYFLDKEKDKKNEELINFIKTIFVVYGIGTGVRSALRLIMGV
jgi:uncharacterized membrane protein